MVSFCIVIWGANAGNLGVECNKTYSEACTPVFRARACVFAQLTWMILLSAWEFKSLRRSVFRLDPDDPSRFPLFKDLYSNRFLFWAVVIGGLSVFPVVYIPYVNRELFKHTGISWEWAVAIGFSLLFVFGIEAWKLVKRRFNLLEHKGVARDDKFNQGEAETGTSFKKSMTYSSFKEWASFSRKDSGSGKANGEADGNANGDASGAPNKVHSNVNHQAV